MCPDYRLSIGRERTAANGRARTPAPESATSGPTRPPTDGSPVGSCFPVSRVMPTLGGAGAFALAVSPIVSGDGARQ